MHTTDFIWMVLGDIEFKQRRQENVEFCSQVVLSIFISPLVAVIKYPHESNLREKGPILVHSSRSQSIITDK